MIKEEEITQVVETISMEMIEDEENFIFQRIMPFCEEIIERKINKEELKKILIVYNNSPKQEDCKMTKEEVLAELDTFRRIAKSERGKRALDIAIEFFKE